MTAAAARVWQLPAGPVLVGYAELAGGQGASGDDLRAWCQQRLPPAAVPQRVQVLAVLPRSAGGKVQRAELQPSAEVAAALAVGAHAAAATQVAEAAPACTRAHPAIEEGSAPLGSARPAKRPRAASASPPAEVQQPPAAAMPTRHQAPPPRMRPPVSEAEVSVAFALALGHSDFEATTNLFSIGGTSLTAAEIAGQVAGGRVEAVVQHPTVRSLAAHLSDLAQGQAGGVQGRPAAAAGQGASAHGEQQRGQPAEPAAAIAGARLLDMHAGHAGISLRLAWRAKLLQCVDAGPLMVAEHQLAQQRGQQREQQPTLPHEAADRTFACSHGGDVCCFDSASGQRLWQAVLPDRTDAGLALCHGPSRSGGGGLQPEQQGSRQSGSGRQGGCLQQGEQGQTFLAAATNGGELYFLDAADGTVVGSVRAGGGMRAAPACDPWTGLVWQPTHGQQLLLACAPGEEVGRLPLPAAVSAAVSFSAALRLAFVCCLDGTLLAVQSGGQRPLEQQHMLERQGDQGERQGMEKAAASQLQVAWQWRAAAPLFTPAVAAGSSVLVAAVDGSVAALSCRDGSQLWRTEVPGAVFAPPLLLPPSAASAAHSAVLLVGTQLGHLAALEASTGRRLATAQPGDQVTGLRLVPTLCSTHGAGLQAGAAGTRQSQRQLVVATLACGAVVLVDAAAMLQSGGSFQGAQCQDGRSSAVECGDWLVDAVRLSGDVFAPPAAAPVCLGAASVAVGCRDDHLYCLDVSV